MTRTPIHDIQAEEEREEVPAAVVVATPLHRTVSAETIILDPEEDEPPAETVRESTESTEAETSAKESTVAVLEYQNRENVELHPKEQQ